jgi:hypothetical protein
MTKIEQNPPEFNPAVVMVLPTTAGGKSELHQAALDYAAQGRAVFPCEAGKKTPATPHGFKDATTDAAQIDAWWTENPSYNIAFEPEQAGLAIIDADTYHDGCNIDLILDLPPTYEISTPRGGTHYYFFGSVPTTVGDENKPDKGLGPHIDTRGRGSYALLPPSVVDGKCYAVTADRPIAPLPEAIAAKLAKRIEAATASPDIELDLPVNIARARSHLIGLVERGRLAVEGKRGHDTCYEVACELVRDLGLSSNTALELMLELWYPHCTPNDNPNFVRERILSAGRNGQNAVGAYAALPPEVAFDGANLPAISEPKADEPDKWDGTDRTAVNRWLELMAGSRPIDDAHLPAPEFYDDDHMLQRDREEGYVAVFVGKKGSMKTYVMLSMLTKLAVEKKLKVVYFAGEGAYGVRTTRLQAIAKAHGIPLDELSKYWLTRKAAPNFFDMNAMAALMMLLKQDRPDIVVFDTLGQTAPGQDLNSPGFGTALTATTRIIRHEFKCCVILLHHLGKNEAKGGLGSTMIIADPGTVGEIRGVAGNKVIREVWLSDVREGDSQRAIGFRLQMSSSLRGITAPVPVRISDEELATAKSKPVKVDPEEGTFAELGARIRMILQTFNIYSEDAGMFDDAIADKLACQDFKDADLSNREIGQKFDNAKARYLKLLERAAGRPARPGRLASLSGTRPHPGGTKLYRCWFLPAPLDLEIVDDEAER